jgi:hypothetical protein
MYTRHKSVRTKKLSRLNVTKNKRLKLNAGAATLVLILMLAILPISAVTQRLTTSDTDTAEKINRRLQKSRMNLDKKNNDNLIPIESNQPVENGEPLSSNVDSPTNDKLCNQTSGSSVSKDMWVWQPTAASNPSERETLFTFAKSRNVQKVYLESEKLLADDQTSLASFIEIAKQNCIDVELLFGAADWSFTRNHSYAVALAQKSIAFAQSAKVAPVGIQFDVEPYNTAEYKADPNAGGNQYLDMLEKINAVTKDSNLYFAKSVPLGFKFQTINRNGTLVKMSEATIDRVDRVVLMAYRDTADRVIADSVEEIFYASKTGKKLVIGAETDCNTGEVETITYCEEGQAYMNNELTKIHTASISSAAYSGIAIHDYAAYKILKP